MALFCERSGELDGSAWYCMVLHGSLRPRAAFWNRMESVLAPWTFMSLRRKRERESLWIYMANTSLSRDVQGGRSLKGE